MDRSRYGCLLIALLLGVAARTAAADEGKASPTIAAATAPGDANAQSEEYYELYQVFADAIDQVERNYVKSVSRRELMEAAINGVVGKLDPYSSYISPEDLSRFKSSVESQFGGIGIQITVDHEQLMILSPLVGTPAYKAGLHAGDAIVEIDGKPTEGMSVEDGATRLKGEPGTSVTLTVVPAGTATKKTVTVKRELIHIDTVLGDRRWKNDIWDFQLDHDRHIGYVRLTAFSRDTAHDLKKAVDQLKRDGLKGLIIDLRFNPGGLLTSAIEISDMFVAEGRIVSTKGRNTVERTWEAQKEGTYEGFPMAVLVNRYSASASEILAACLQDHKRAVVIGERTWGKGSVQNVIELESGKSALKLTTASYRRPSGKNIHRFPDAKPGDEWGVAPDTGFELKLTDRELRDLVRYRSQRDIVNAPPPSAAESAPASPPREKPQATQAVPAAPAPAKPPATEAAPPATPKPPADAGSPSEGAAAEGAVAEAGQPFVDRQLQKAIDHLSQSLAKAK